VICDANRIGKGEAREKEEKKDAELSVAAFKRQLASLKDKVTSIEADVEHYCTLVQNLR
jgi:kinetochore protein Spc25, fungi type